MLTPDMPEDEALRLVALSSLDVGEHEIDEVLNRLVDVAQRQSGAPIAFISLIGAERQRFIAKSGLDLVETTRSEALCAHAILEPHKLLWVADAWLDPRFKDNPLVRGTQPIRFYLGAPLLVNGRAVGSFCLAGPEPRARDEALAGFLADLSSIASERLAGRQKRTSLERALEAASDALVVADEENRYVYWSKGAERLFGYTAAEAIGSTGALLGLDCEEIYAAATLGGDRDDGSGGVRAEAVARRKDGSTVDIEVCLAVWHEGPAKRTSATIRDIGERKAYKAELVRSKTRAEAANVAKSAFLANMSHELRTPLNGVIGVVELLAATPMTEHQKELTGIIQTSADQLRSLIGDILDLARIESGEVEIAQEVFDLGAEIERVRRLCALRASEKGLELSLDPVADVGLVVGDPLRLRQVIVNLLNNAIKFTTAGSVSLCVKRLPDEVFRFEVKDTGIGFSDDQREALFERFQQADGTITRRFGGTGLGLAISRELVEAMGGVIDCRAVPGEGAAFWFDVKLPPGKIEAAPEPDIVATTEAAVAHVLVADDSETNRRVAELILSAAGVASTVVEDGVMAVEAWRHARFDVVLMDMMMPRMDGLAATRAIRGLEAAEGRPRTPIIMLTANTSREHVEAALLAGADLHLPKPITASALYEALAAAAGADIDSGADTVSL